MKQIFIKLSLIYFGLMSPQLCAEKLIGSILNSDVPSTLIELDPTTGEKIKTIGNIGYRVNGMTYDVTNNTLYATTSAKDASFPNGLISIDLTTGIGSPIGSGSDSASINNLTINKAGDLYSVGWIEAKDRLVLWDKKEGSFTPVGEIGILSAQHGLSFDNTDTLFLVNGQTGDLGIYQVNTTSGSATPIGDFSDYENHIAHHGDFHPTSNLYYGLDATQRQKIPERNIFVIHTGANKIIKTISTVDDLYTLAFIPTLPSPGECNGVEGLNISDIICTINIVLSSPK